MHKYDILFYRGSNTISRAVKRITKSQYSHVALVINEYLVVETNWYYPVRFRRNRYLEHEEFTLKRVENLTEEQQEKIFEFISLYLDTRYDYIQIFYHVLNVVFGTKLKNNPNLYTCSELIDRAFQYAGIDLVPGREDGDLTPEELFNSPLLVECE